MKESRLNLKKNSIHIAYVVHNYAMIGDARALLSKHFTTTQWVRALSDVGVQVTVFYRFAKDEKLQIDGVNYYFIADRLPPELKSYHLAYGFHNKVATYIRKNNIDVIHAHNSLALVPNMVLRRLMPGRCMLIQDHAGVQTINRKHLLKLALRRVDAVVFSSEGQEKPWLDARILKKKQCYFVMENSSKFSFEDRDRARQKTALSGDAVFLWVGNLDENKDPYTALKAFRKFVEDAPSARLYMIYRLLANEMEVKSFIEEDAVLSKHVTMLGSKKRADLEDYYNSADYIISASHKEGSGYSVIEAMSCGVIPILTRIPSFVSLTGNGKIGLLFDVGNEQMLYDRLVETINANVKVDSEAVLNYFHVHFSFAAIANKMKNIYNELLNQHD